jgi:two-component system chemotaxis response regulator CheY
MALRVMVVDDALFMRNMLKDIFVRAGYEVVAEGENGEVALQLYQDTRPDLVTMDIVMPKKSGIEALQEIVADDPQARVVMVSALGQDSLVLEAVEAGASDFIVKPFREDKVLETIRRVVEQD